MRSLADTGAQKSVQTRLHQRHALRAQAIAYGCEAPPLLLMGRTELLSFLNAAPFSLSSNRSFRLDAFPNRVRTTSCVLRPSWIRDSPYHSKQLQTGYLEGRSPPIHEHTPTTVSNSQGRLPHNSATAENRQSSEPPETTKLIERPGTCTEDKYSPTLSFPFQSNVGVSSGPSTLQHNSQAKENVSFENEILTPTINEPAKTKKKRGPRQGQDMRQCVVARKLMPKSQLWRVIRVSTTPTHSNGTKNRPSTHSNDRLPRRRERRAMQHAKLPSSRSRNGRKQRQQNSRRVVLDHGEGRSAYVSRSLSAVREAMKCNLLSRALRVNVPQAIYDELEQRARELERLDRGHE